MTHHNGQTGELWTLLEALCENRLTTAETTRLEEIVVADREARRIYLQYIELHGTLHWDTALGCETDSELDDISAAAFLPTALPAAFTAESLPSRRSSHAGRRQRRTARRMASAASILAASVLVAAAAWIGSSPRAPRDHSPNLENGQHIARPEVTPPRPATPSGRERIDSPLPDRQPVRIAAADAGHGGQTTTPLSIPTVAPEAPVEAPLPRTETGSTRESVVALIDRDIRRGWADSNVRSSPRADDAEWMRRVYLDVIGRIPSVSEAESFLASRDPRKREQLVDRLLDDPAYARNWTTIWGNLLVGRSNDSPNVDRFALNDFLRQSFARNRPWSEVVMELVSAEGNQHDNGASNYLLAHLNNEAVPATAITARLFMGTQVQCTQCHDHPHNDWKQNQFWELNSFFQQTELVHRDNPDADRDEPSRQAELISEPVGGPIYFETRQGLMRAAFPKFAGVQIDADGSVNRRQELARLMVQGEQPLVATAMVNRMWGHFFGSGFTRPIDDMGPHNPPSHPELLDRVSSEFVQSGYDLKQLIRWICNSEAYQLSSRWGDGNRVDDPEAGYSPLFSRVYVKPMTAEQLYDSLLVATKAHETAGSNWEAVEQRRQEWLQQFVIAFGTEENDEAVTFDGTVPQALMMMNGPFVEAAVSRHPGTLFSEVLTERSSEKDKIRKLCLSALSRYPTDRELAAIRKLLRERGLSDPGAPRTPTSLAMLEQGYQDIFWAYLNSSEFILIH